MPIKLIIISLFISLNLQAQYKKQAVKYIEKLSSKSYNGRGYTNNGHIKASRFIAQNLVKNGFTTSFQNFSFPIVTYPQTVSCKLNNKTLKPGYDFIINAGSPTTQGTFPIIIASRSQILKASTRDSIIQISKNKFICITVQSNADTGKVVTDSLHKVLLYFQYKLKPDIAGLINHDTSTSKWGISQTLHPYPIIEICKKLDISTLKTITLDIQAQQIQCTSQNVIGILKGSQYPDSCIVFTCHYDHLGNMGKQCFFPGANDNASGTALLLTMADYYSKHPQKYTVICIAFSAEEVGLIGSKFFVENPLIPLKNIRFLLNFDMVGTGIDGLKVVNGSNLKPQFTILEQLNDSLHLLSSLQPRVQGCISDQCYFFKSGVPCFFFYTLGGPKYYHDVYDRIKTLPLTAFDNIVHLSIRFIDEITTDFK